MRRSRVMAHTIFAIIILILSVHPFLNAADEHDQTLQSIDKKIEEVNRAIEKNWADTSKAEVQRQDDFIGEWETYQEELNTIKKLNQNAKTLEKKLDKLKQERTEYLKSK